MAHAPSRLSLAGLLAAWLLLSVGCTRPSQPAALPTPPAATPAEAGGLVFLPLVAQSTAPESTTVEREAAPARHLFLPLVQRSPEAARLQIPDLEVDVEIVPAPIRGGAWDLDGLGRSVGRLETTGAGPGDALAPVLAGHASLPSGASGPFGYLWKLKPGAEVVYIADGRRYEYRVEEKRPLAEDAVAAVYVRDGRRLLLLTCDGWDFARGEYAGRLLVMAVLEAEARAEAP